jgi:hypothetical protein
MTTTSFVSVEELAAFLRRDIDVGDPSAQLYVELATGMVRRVTGQTIEKVEGDTVKLDGVTRRLVFLPQIPVLAVSSVAITTNGTATDLVEVDDFDWSPNGELRRLPEWTLWHADRQGIVVTYDHGYDPLPEDIRMVTLQLAARLWANPSGQSSERTLNYSANYRELMTVDELAILDGYVLTE